MEHIKSNKHHCEYWSDGDYASEGNDCTKLKNLKELYSVDEDIVVKDEEED